jgi:transcriptional regulator with XRE-family HTH domain
MNEPTAAHPLRRERLRRGWSQVKLCGLTGIAPSDLSLIERGLQPAFPGWQRRIAEAFGVPAEELFPPATTTTTPAA